MLTSLRAMARRSSILHTTSRGMSDIQQGDKVAWNWGSSHAEGTVQQVATHKLEKDIKVRRLLLCFPILRPTLPRWVGVAKVANLNTHTLLLLTQGKHVTRKGDEDNPALEIKSSKSGTPVLKRVSECHKLDEHEEIDSEHVETRRQKEMEQSRQG